MCEMDDATTRIDRRTVLRTAGLAGLAAAFGPKALALLGEGGERGDHLRADARDDRGAVLGRGHDDAARHPRGQAGAAAADPLHGRQREDVQDDQGRRRRDLARRRRGRVLGLRRRLVGRRPAGRRRWRRPRRATSVATRRAMRAARRSSSRSSRAGTAGRTPHIHMKVQRRRRHRPHGPGLLRREDHGGRLQAGAVPRPGPGRHAARLGHDLRRGRRLARAAEARQAPGGAKGYLGTIVIGVAV